MWDLIVSVPDHCLSFYFTSFAKKVVTSGFCDQSRFNRKLRKKSIKLTSCYEEIKSLTGFTVLCKHLQPVLLLK